MNAKKFAIAGLTAGLVLALVGIAGGLGRSNATEQTPNRSVLALDQMYGLAPIEDAIELWRSRSEEQPLDYLSRTQLGVTLATQAREQADLVGYEMAERALREALELNPGHKPAQLQLASTLRSQHRFGEALELVDTLAAEDPTSLSAVALQGDANFELGNYDIAEGRFLRLAAAERGAPALSRLARLAWVQGRNDEAVALAAEALDQSQALALRPSSAAFYWFQLGHFRFQSGDTSGAIQALTEARRIAPDDPTATETLAWIHAAVGNHEEAASLYEMLLATGPAADLHGSYADVLRRLGDQRAAATQEQLGLDLAELTIDRFPAERRHLANFFFTRDPETALRLAEADIAERHDVEAWDTLAWALHLNGRDTEASEAVTEALAQGTRSALLLYHAAAIEAARGNNGQAEIHLRDALSINPHFHPTQSDDAARLRNSIAATT